VAAVTQTFPVTAYEARKVARVGHIFSKIRSTQLVETMEFPEVEPNVDYPFTLDNAKESNKNQNEVLTGRFLATEKNFDRWFPISPHLIPPDFLRGVNRENG